MRKEKQQKQLWILFQTFRKIPMGTSVVKFSVKLLPVNMGFNYSGFKFSPDIQSTGPSFQRCSTEVAVLH